MRRIVPGDIVFCKRTGYEHYGIYVGGNRIIHYESSIKDKIEGRPKVAETTIAKFKGEDIIFTINPEHLLSFFQDYGLFDEGNYKFYSPSETVRRAKSKLGTADYNLLWNNCEHFALWCKTGLATSSQIGTAAEFLISGIPIIGFIINSKRLEKQIFMEEAQY
ncbi:lecithin retinol acyltransferase family protein [uncultured Veillonella sp.]|uniref:lecithin retinol acyltransferase family protein n=1 Tax=uncultured Veillonella sp. TaxID=159268 RepID=UPI0025ED2B5F|nr:lecithin retinol acyltransferase family protein [uncultured Veillonella sp.]